MYEIISTLDFLVAFILWVVLTTLALAIVNILPLSRSVVWQDKIGGIAIIASSVATLVIWLWLQCQFVLDAPSLYPACHRLGFWP